MSAGLMFWVIWLIAILFAGFGYWKDATNRYLIGGDIIVMILIALLGWKTFGPILH